jgi:Calcineurin-like phosphoesterase
VLIWRIIENGEKELIRIYMLFRLSKMFISTLLSLLVTTVMMLSIIVNGNSITDHFNYAYATTTIPGFNFAAAGDWGCTDDTIDTVNNILDKSSELVLGLGDYSYEMDSADCWFEDIQPIDNIMKIAIGNHDVDSYDKLNSLMNHFNLAKPYYSFDYQNVHFIALATDKEYLDMSKDKAKEQLAFVTSDLEKASTNPNIDWIIPFFHSIMYIRDTSTIDGPYDHNLIDIYHPLFEQYGIKLVLQAHAHTYERTYPLRFNVEDSKDPIITNKDLSNYYYNTDGLVIATVGTGGATSTVSHTDSEYRAVVYKDLFGFLNVDVSSDGTTLVCTFYENNGGQIKDQFTITKLEVVEDNDDLPLPSPIDLPVQEEEEKTD